MDLYQQLLQEAQSLRDRPQTSVASKAIERQHSKNRMTVWERIHQLTQGRYKVFRRNFGAGLDGAAIVTVIGEIKVLGRARQVAIYGHDFTQQAGAMDATNGRKLAEFLFQAGKLGLPVIGMNDSAGAYVPAGVGGLESYAQAFTALRKISGVVPSIMCMFGFNAGGGAYLPRQGSFIIQPQATFFGLTGPGVVQKVLGETVAAEDLGGPKVHSASGVTDFTATDEQAALDFIPHLLAYIPDHSGVAPQRLVSLDPDNRPSIMTEEILRDTINAPAGFHTPFDIRFIVQDLADFGDYLEFQPSRAGNMICAFARMSGLVVGFCANNSGISSGQIDIQAANKATRFLRFCNIYNIPVIFLEDTTGFLPGQAQEEQGIVQAGRALLDAIVDLRVPRILVVVRNAFGGAYASFNNYATGADVVLALPTARIAVMGTAGVTFVYKKELAAIQADYAQSCASDASHALKEQAEHDRLLALKALDQRYTDTFLNAEAALALGAVSEIILPLTLRCELIAHLNILWSGYTPSAMGGPQREFF